MFWVLAFCHVLWERADTENVSFINSWWSGQMYIYLSTLQSMKTNVIVMHPLMQHYSFLFNKKITT